MAALSASLAAGLGALLIGFFAETLGYFGEFGNLQVALAGLVVTLAAVVLVILGALVGARRRGGVLPVVLLSSGTWLLAGFAAGVTLGTTDNGYCFDAPQVFRETALALIRIPALAVVAAAVSIVAWLLLARSDRLQIPVAARSVAVGFGLATTITVAMAALLTVGMTSDGFAGSRACALTTGLAVGGAFGGVFLALGLLLLPLALISRGRARSGVLTPWLGVPAAAILLHLAYLAGARIVDAAQQPVDRAGTAQLALSGRSFGQHSASGEVVCTLSHGGGLLVDGSSLLTVDGRPARLRLDLTTRGTVASVEASVGDVYKIWVSERTDIEPEAGWTRESGTVRTNRLSQLDPAPGDAAEDWQATLSWDCTP